MHQKESKSVVLIYPYWADLGFVYYYNRDIYQDFRHYDSLLLKNNIIHVWNVQGAIENIGKYKSNRILYFQDGQLDDKAIYNFLDSTHTRIDSSFYPQCISLVVFEPKSKF